MVSSGTVTGNTVASTVTAAVNVNGDHTGVPGEPDEMQPMSNYGSRRRGTTMVDRSVLEGVRVSLTVSAHR